MVRENLVASAVNFLQDPSVAASSVEKKIAFLQSKNLTKDEIDLALAQAAEAPQASATAFSAPPSAYNNASQRANFPQTYSYGSYPPGPWATPQSPSRRDWRDWFIMATVTSGLGYAIYTAAQRYVIPMIAPPTPPQLEQDKAAIDDSFEKAFTLIEQLAADTAAIKASEAERTEKLDLALKDVDTVIADLKLSNARRETENRMILDQVNEMKGLVPRALDGWKQGSDARLDELAQEMQSLKRLLETRFGRTAGTNPPIGRAYHGDKPKDDSGPDSSQDGQVASSAILTPEAQDLSKPEAGHNRRTGDRRAAIPAWQMAAASQGQE